MQSDRWRHVDVVEYGADPTGDDDVAPVLEEILAEEGGDDLLLLFPPGTYRMEGGFEHETFRNFGVLGYNATIELSSDFEGVGVYDDKVFALGPSQAYSGHNVYVGGFEFDFRNLRGSDDLEASAVATYGSGRVIFESLRTVGQPANGFRMIELIGLGECRGLIRDCVVEGAPGAGVYVETDPRASVRITDCLVRDCGDNGFYCSNASVLIENCTAIDNAISNIRLGGTVRNSTVFVRDAALRSARGYWVRNGDCQVENCYGYNDADGSRPVLEVAPSASSVTIANSRFGSDSDQRIAIVNENVANDRNTVTFRDCAFFGEKDASRTEEAIAVIRHDTTFADCSCTLTGDVIPIRFWGNARNGRVIGGRYESERPITFSSGPGGLVRDADLVTDHPDGQLDVRTSDVVVENVQGEVSEDVRTIVNGVGRNDTMDPASGGDWNENGREGLLVMWTDASADEERMSVYRGGEWHSWQVE